LREEVEKRQEKIIMIMHNSLAFVITAFAFGIVNTHAGLRGDHPLRRHLSDELSCLDETVDLSFNDATITMNNLGGFGPEEDTNMEHNVMMFENVGNYKGTDIDLVVSVKDGSVYMPGRSKSNGMLCGVDANDKFIMCDINHTGGHFGQINVDADQDATFLFTFYKHGTYATTNPEQIVLDAFKASFYDIDQGGKLNEKFIVKGWETALYDRDTDEALFSETDYDCADVEENCLFAASTMIGKACDNPTDPMELSEELTCKGNTVNQLARSFQVDFLDKSSFELQFKVAHNPNKTDGTNRNVVFAFASAWDFKCEDRKTPEPIGLLC